MILDITDYAIFIGTILCILLGIFGLSQKVELVNPFNVPISEWGNYSLNDFLEPIVIVMVIILWMIFSGILIFTSLGILYYSWKYTKEMKRYS